MNAAGVIRFRDRADGGRRLGERLGGRELRDPLVLAIPRGGVATGLALARVLGAELDVVLSRKLRAPFNPEYAIGAISEDGHVTLNPEAAGTSEEYLGEETRHQLAEISRRKKLLRAVRPAAPIEGRSVIVTDDGVATGSTMTAALRTVRSQGPRELIMAVPVAPPDRLELMRPLCDEVVCLLAPEDFSAVGQFYDRFDPVEDEEVVRMLREATGGSDESRSAGPIRGRAVGRGPRAARGTSAASSPGAPASAARCRRVPPPL
jgi:predicted phosphoribosyltransferase